MNKALNVLEKYALKVAAIGILIIVILIGIRILEILG